jgi:hypothetical protein
VVAHDPRDRHRADPRAQHQQRQRQPGGRRAAGQVLGQQRPRRAPGGQAQGAQQLRDHQHPHRASLQRLQARRRGGHGCCASLEVVVAVELDAASVAEPAGGVQHLFATDSRR